MGRGSRHWEPHNHLKHGPHAGPGGVTTHGSFTLTTDLGLRE